MTKEEKIERLKSYNLLGKEVESLREELKIWEARAEKITATMSPAPSGGGGGGDKIQTSVEHICELQEQLNKTVNALVKVRTEIEKALQNMSDCTLRNLLRDCYLDNLPLSAVAERIGYSYTQTKRLHIKAVNELQF